MDSSTEEIDEDIFESPIDVYETWVEREHIDSTKCKFKKYASNKKMLTHQKREIQKYEVQYLHTSRERKMDTINSDFLSECIEHYRIADEASSDFESDDSSDAEEFQTVVLQDPMEYNPSLHLPIDCWKLIAELLEPVPNLIMFSQVCKAFYQISQNQNLWTKLLLDGNHQSITNQSWKHLFSVRISPHILKSITLKSLDYIELELAQAAMPIEYFHVECQILDAKFLVQLLQNWGKTLQTLKIIDCTVDTVGIYFEFTLEGILPSLHTVDLEHSKISPRLATALFKNAGNLKKLHWPKFRDGLYVTRLWDDILNAPHLEELVYFQPYSKHEDHTESQLDAFVRACSKVTKLEISCSKDITYATLSDLNLTELRLYGSTNSLKLSNAIPTLSKLYLPHLVSSNTGLQLCTNLTEITLDECNSNSLLDLLYPLQQLQTLHVKRFNNNLDHTEVMLLATQLSMLPKLAHLNVVALTMHETLPLLAKMKLKYWAVHDVTLSVSVFQSSMEGSPLAENLEHWRLDRVTFDGEEDSVYFFFPKLKHIDLKHVNDFTCFRKLLENSPIESAFIQDMFFTRESTQRIQLLPNTVKECTYQAAQTNPRYVTAAKRAFGGLNVKLNNAWCNW